MKPVIRASGFLNFNYVIKNHDVIIQYTYYKRSRGNMGRGAADASFPLCTLLVVDAKEY